MPVTIKDIAKKMGVSHTTVSRALNGNQIIPESTAAGIRKAAEEMGYFPSVAARGLKTNHSQVIGTVVSRIDNPYFGEIIQGIENILQQNGYSLFVASSHLDLTNEENIVRAFAEHRVDGVIICSVSFSSQHAEKLAQYDIPIVVVNNESPEEYRCSISHDDVDGASQITHHLLSLGHTRIAYIGNSLAERINQERMQGFYKEMALAGIPEDEYLILSTSGGEIENGIQGMECLLNEKFDPTAVFCFNDLMAIGALNLLNKNGIRVPDDISVAGFDNIAISAYTSPPLTTFDQPKRRIGAEAADMLLNMIQSPDGNQNEGQLSRVLHGILLTRESTSPPRIKE